MIISRTPFRISFVGGGTDLPWFYSEHGGAVISTSINKYMYLTAHQMFDNKLTLLKYSKTELVSEVQDLQHPIAREILSGLNLQGLDISVSSDIPSGTGLGSSSAFTVGLINLLNSYVGKYLSKSELAQAACEIEIEKLKEPIGKQDQYASAYGGLNFIEFLRNGQVEVTPLIHSSNAIEWLNNSLILIRTKNLQRSASQELKKQRLLATQSGSISKSLCELRDLAHDSKNEIEKDPTQIGNLLARSWELKVKSNPHVASTDIIDLIALGRKNGALGAKLLGAGGSGFVLFIVPPEIKTKFSQRMYPLISHSVKLDFSGSTIIYDHP